MLHFIEGKAGTGKTTHILGLIDAYSENINDKVYAIVPDQFSFEFERNLYDHLGLKRFNAVNISISSFRKLSEEILETSGLPHKKYASEQVKSVIMFRALKSLSASKRLLYFSKQTSQHTFRKKALEMIKELSDNRITPQMLKTRFNFADIDANNTKGISSLTLKMHDIAEIMSEYVAILTQTGYRDDINEFSEAARLAFETQFFAEKTIFIDGFTGFTAGEMTLIEVMIKHAKNVYIALTFNGFHENSNFEDIPIDITDLFSPVKKTYSYIKTMAKNAEIEIDEEILSKQVRFENTSLALFSENALSYETTRSSIICEEIQITQAIDIYDEVEYIGSLIHKLCVEDRIFKFNDFVIAVSDTDEYSSIVAGVFSRLEIPIFLDQKTPATHQSIIIFIMSFLRIACLKNPETEDYLRLLKTGFLRYKNESNNYVEIPENDIFDFDDFCYINDVRGFHFDEPFEDERFERIRNIIHSKSDEFKRLSDNKDGKTICEKLAAVLSAFEIPERLSSLSDESFNDLQKQRLTISAWNIFCTVIEDLHECLSSEEILSISEFYELVEVIIRDQKISSPPQTLDCVSLVPAGTARLNNPKCTIIMGANEDVIPAVPIRNSLISDTDLEILRSKNIRIVGETNEKIAEERLAIYNICSGAKNRVFLTYPRSDHSGKPLLPSTIIKNAINVFGDRVFTRTENSSAEFYCRTPKNAYNKYIETQVIYPETAINIKAALEQSEEIGDRVFVTQANMNINKNTADKLYGNRLNLSATSFEEFCKCPFMFFAKRGLKLKTREKIEFDAQIRGNVVHEVLKKIVDEIDNYKPGEKQKIDAVVQKHMTDYFSELPGEKRYKSTLFSAEYEKLKGAIVAVAEHLIDEFSQSKFVPSDTEFKFGFLDMSENEPPFRISINEEKTAYFSGSVDRVDTYKNFIRITDYKTGKKGWDYKKMAEGLDLQPLIYIFALTDKNANKYKDFSPVGTLFLFAYDPAPEENDRHTENIENTLKRPIGAVIDDIDIIDAMEDIPEKTSGKFIPVTMKKSDKNGEKQLSLRGTSVLSADEFESFKDHVKNAVKHIGKSIFEGVSEPLPITELSPDNNEIKNEYVPCSYCDYASICGNYPSLKKFKTFKNDDNITAKKMIIDGTAFCEKDNNREN
jgi:ATP-dependent helicase/nuclease subunit B